VPGSRALFHHVITFFLEVSMLRYAAIATIAIGAFAFAPVVGLADSTTITAAGSTALEPLAKAAAEAYQAKNPDIKISISGGGSGNGIAQVAAKSVDIGNSDILAKNYPDLVDHRVCVTGFAIVGNPDIGVDNLTKAQVQDIFTGKVTNWKDVGGKDEKIVIINRPRSSGTRAVFIQTMMGGKPVIESGLVEDATGTVVTTVKSQPGSVSYAAFSGIRGGGLAEIKVDGIAPTDDNLTSGKWPIWSYEHMYTNGPPSKEVSRFISFVESNSTIVHQLGYILTRDMKVSETDR
jgi:phosphate transport system substrate-binding protein